MSKIVIYTLTIMAGVVIAYFVASLTNMVFPKLAMPVFLIFCFLWIRAGWRIAKQRDRERDQDRDGTRW